MAGLLLILTVRAIDYLFYAARAVTFPFGLDYGEGPLWQQAMMIPGPQMYGEITHPPFIIFIYPPVYHLSVRALAAIGIDPLAAGRGISLAATIAIAVLVGSITLIAMKKSAATRARIFGSALAGLMVLTYRPVQELAVWMRPDALAIAFSMAGVYVAIIAQQRTNILLLAVLLFSFAIYTKQTELSAPIAALVVAAIINFRWALKAVVFGLIISGVALIILLLATHGGFWRHIIEYNAHNRFILKNIPHLLVRQRGDALGLLTGVMAFGFLWRTEETLYPGRDLRAWAAAMRQSKKLRALSIASVWFVLASAQLITLGRPGSWDNYFVEWMCITTIPIGMTATIAWAGLATGDTPTPLSGLAGVFLTLILGAHVLHRSPFEFPIVDNPRAIALRAHLVDLIRQSRKPVLSDEMVLLLRAGQQVFIETAIFTELAYTGYWNQEPLLKLIQNHDFGFVIMGETMKDAEGAGLFTPQVARTIEDNYPMVEHLGEFVIRRPSGPE